jgi:hypothetical protein
LTTRCGDSQDDQQTTQLVAYGLGVDEDKAATLGARAGGGKTTDIDGSGAYVAATLTAGQHNPGVSPPGRRSEDDRNLVVSALTANMAGGGGGVDDNTAQAGHLIIERSRPL